MKDIIELISNKIERPKEYHNFADKKNILNIPNTVNVVSNISFLIPVFYLLKSTKKRSLKVNLLMIHLVLLGIASTYYHYIPSDKTLFWDSNYFNGCIEYIHDTSEFTKRRRKSRFISIVVLSFWILECNILEIYG